LMPPVKASAGGTNAEGSSRRGGYPQGAPRPAVAPQGRERRFRRSAALDGKCRAVPAPEGVTAGGAQRRPGYAGPRHNKARARPEGARAVNKALFAPPGQPGGAQARRALQGEARKAWIFEGRRLQEIHAQARRALQAEGRKARARYWHICPCIAPARASYLMGIPFSGPSTVAGSALAARAAQRGAAKLSKKGAPWLKAGSA